MKKLLISIISFMVFSLYAQETTPKNGKWESHYNTGEISETGYYRNGKKDAVWQVYYKNGNIKEMASYKQGKRIGDWKMFDENGKLQSVQKIAENGKPYLSITYFSNGKMASQYDVLKGEQQEYYENGQLKELAHYKNDIKDGIYKTYYENGNLKLEGTYKNDKRIGWFSYYKEDGNPERATSYQAETEREDGEKLYYKNGQLKILKLYHRPGVVAWKYYYPNGQLQGLAYYLGIEDPDSDGYYNQEKTGIWKHFDQNGTLIEEMPFKKNKITGKHKIYHNGKIYKTQLWENSKLEEVLSCVDKNGKALPKGTLKDGNGEVYEYNEEGKLMNRALIKDGRLADGHTFIDLIWSDQEKLNTEAWNAYAYALTSEELNWAVLWVERSIALDKNYYNMDTYAALLFRTGKKQKAIQIAKEAIAIAKAKGEDYSETVKLIKTNQ